MNVKEATRHLLKQLETIGWTVFPGKYPRAHLGKRMLLFRQRSILVSPGGTDADWRLPSAKHYASCLYMLLLDSGEATL